MARVNQPEHERRDFFLYIDEFHNFTTDALHHTRRSPQIPAVPLTFPSIHRPARFPSGSARQRRHFGLLPHWQHGRGGPRARIGETFPPTNFVDLDRYEVLVKLMRCKDVVAEPLLAGAGGVTTANDRGLWVRNLVGQIILALREGAFGAPTSKAPATEGVRRGRRCIPAGMDGLRRADRRVDGAAPVTTAGRLVTKTAA